MKKILFYGNCQLGTLSKHIRNCSDEFQILNCKDYGLEQFWTDQGLFAIWSYDNRYNQKKFYKNVIKAVRDCDIFIFQHHKNELTNIEELTTEFLQSQLKPQSISICLPSLRYGGYISDRKDYKSSVTNKIISLYKNKKTLQEIVSFLKNENFEEARKEMLEEHKISINKMKEYDVICKEKYTNYLSFTNFFESNYKNKLLTYCYVHPSIHYYNELIRNLSKYGININVFFNKNSILPTCSYLCSYELKCFNEHFPNMECTKKHDNFFIEKKINEENIQKIIKEHENI